MTDTSSNDPIPVTQILAQRRRLRRIVLLVIVPSIVLVAIVAIYLSGGRYVETDNAYVKAEKVPVSADISGTVRQVLVKENQAVTVGQPLFRIDSGSFQIAVARAEAKLSQVRTDLVALKASYREKQAEITLARTNSEFARKNQQRQADLVTKNFISPSKFDDAKQSADISRQQIATLEQDLKRIAETLGGSVDAPVEHHPSYLIALAELDQAHLDLTRTEIRASLAGNVGKPPKPGQYITAGNTAMALVVSGNLWVEANFTETDLTYVQPGQRVSIHIDTYPDLVWKGVVDSLSPATGAEFSVIPAQNATGNWVKIAQRVPIHIKLLSDPGLPLLRAGLSAVVEIDTQRHRRLPGFSH